MVKRGTCIRCAPSGADEEAWHLPSPPQLGLTLQRTENNRDPKTRKEGTAWPCKTTKKATSKRKEWREALLSIKTSNNPQKSLQNITTKMNTRAKQPRRQRSCSLTASRRRAGSGRRHEGRRGCRCQTTCQQTCGSNISRGNPQDTVGMLNTGETLERQNGRLELDTGKMDGAPNKSKAEDTDGGSEKQSQTAKENEAGKKRRRAT